MSQIHEGGIVHKAKLGALVKCVKCGKNKRYGRR